MTRTRPLSGFQLGGPIQKAGRAQEVAQRGGVRGVYVLVPLAVLLVGEEARFLAHGDVRQTARDADS
jgi:hypothetical protein